MRFNFIRLIKGIIFLAALILAIGVLFLPSLQAQTTDATATETTTTTTGGTGGSTSEEYLYYIMQNTYGILQMVNNLPTFMNQLTQLALSWFDPDDSTTTANLQSNFANFGSGLVRNLTVQNAVQPQLMQDLFQKATPTTMPYANDLAYQTLLGMPYFKKDPRNPAGKKPPAVNAAYNYIRNASGIGMPHVAPSKSFSGNVYDQRKYFSYYTGITAAESFNAYVLSYALADSLNGGPFNTAQTTLIKQASDSEWFTKVASEKLGVVLRQILMYQSQSYVLLSQILVTQKQQLTAQAINNALTILNGSDIEKKLVEKASGTPPSP